MTSERVSLSCAAWGTADITCGFIAHSLLWGTASSCFLLFECSMERVPIKPQYLPFHHSSGWDTVNFSPLTLQQGESHHPLLPEFFPHLWTCPQPSSHRCTYHQCLGKARKEALQSGAAIQQLTWGHYCFSSCGSGKELSQSKVK